MLLEVFAWMTSVTLRDETQTLLCHGAVTTKAVAVSSPSKSPCSRRKTGLSMETQSASIPSALDGTREIMASISSYPQDFALWETFIDSDLEHLRQEGNAIERNHMKNVNKLIAGYAYRMVIAGYDVPVLNAPGLFSSDAGHIMGENEPFAACYSDTEKHRNFSLRSADDGVDVAEISIKFGGGGHKHAAGFSIPLADLALLADGF